MAQHFGAGRSTTSCAGTRSDRSGLSAALEYARESGIFVVPALGRSLVDTIETLTTERTQRWTSNRIDDGATSF